VNVPRTPQALLGVMMAEPRLTDVAHRALPVTTKPSQVPAGFPTSDSDTVLLVNSMMSSGCVVILDTALPGVRRRA